jgi:Domain of unknown function (DUF4432)
MVDLFGNKHTRRDLAARTGTLSQLAGVRLMTLGDGVERGIRILEFRTGSGLRFTVLIDRAFDIAEVEHNGRSIGWQSPTGFRHPGLHEVESENGFSWARSFSGFLVTCGLDHMLGPQEVPAEHYNYPYKKSVKHGLHGRVSVIPAKLNGYGETWVGDKCTLYAEGVVVQAAVFGEVLHLHRRIEVEVGSNTIRMTDRVVNAGFLPTPHMLLYHVNLGYPLLDDGADYVAPIRDVLWAGHAGENYRAQNVGYATVPAPIDRFSEQVWQHEMAADKSGEVPVALLNDNLGLGLAVVTRKDQFPCALQWQNFQSGNYTMGIEPLTHHVLGDLAARERGEMIWLKAQESRHYNTRFEVLVGAEALAKKRAEIAAITAQPSNQYQTPSGNFPPLKDNQRSGDQP